MMDGMVHGRLLPDILFAEDFDAPDGGVPAPEPELIEPSFTLAELDAARAQAHDEGAAMERAALEQASRKTREATLATLSAALLETRDEAKRLAEQVAEETARAALSLLAGALPALCGAHGEAEVRSMLRTLLPTLEAEPRITVRLNPHALDGVRADVAMLDDELAARITLTPTDALAPGDVRVTWHEGEMRRDTRAACRAMRSALAEIGLYQEEFTNGQ